jgi:hypothetical protein
MIARESLLSLEAYAKARPEWKRKILEHKKRRTVHVGEHMTLQFEDETLIRYQVQEMLHAERIFEEAGIRGELEAYTPLVPDGSNWKATLFVEYPELEQRRRMLQVLKGIERGVWVQVGELERVHAIADEDLDRETEEKTSAVHFLRFELSEAMKQKLRNGAPVTVGVEHPQYTASVQLAPEVRDSLAGDLR